VGKGAFTRGAEDSTKNCDPPNRADSRKTDRGKGVAKAPAGTALWSNCKNRPRPLNAEESRHFKPAHRTLGLHKEEYQPSQGKRGGERGVHIPTQ